MVGNGLVYGYGIYDSDDKTQVLIDGKRMSRPMYSRWTHMIQRCHSDKFKKKNPTYSDCTICDEWLIFSNFESWVKSQDWIGKHLDKDLIVHGNKRYCPEFCCFIDERTNNLIKINKRKGNLLPGVSLNKKTGRFIAQYSINGRAKHIGVYDTEIEANNSHRIKRAQLFYKESEAYSDPRLKYALEERAKFEIKDLL